MAQCYNHMIMPLANARDKLTQVIWGIEDFRHRFGRAPEGMWLPETAVDLETLELMAQHGIKFTILAPIRPSAAAICGRNRRGMAPTGSIRRAPIGRSCRRDVRSICSSMTDRFRRR